MGQIKMNPINLNNCSRCTNKCCIWYSCLAWQRSIFYNNTLKYTRDGKNIMCKN